MKFETGHGDLRALVSSRRGPVFNPETLSAQTLRPVDSGPKFKRFGQTELIALIWPLVHTVNDIHSLELIHRDIQPRNIFVNKNNQLILGNFGSHRMLDSYKLHNKEATVVECEHYLVEFWDPNLVGRDVIRQVLPWGGSRGPRPLSEIHLRGPGSVLAAESREPPQCQRAAGVDGRREIADSEAEYGRS
eukprot:859769_1